MPTMALELRGYMEVFLGPYGSQGPTLGSLRACAAGLLLQSIQLVGHIVGRHVCDSHARA